MTPKQRQQKVKKQRRSADAYTQSREFKRRVERGGRWVGGQLVRATAGPDCLGELTEKGRRVNINEMNGHMVLDPEGR